MYIYSLYNTRSFNASVQLAPVQLAPIDFAGSASIDGYTAYKYVKSMDGSSDMSVSVGVHPCLLLNPYTIVQFFAVYVEPKTATDAVSPARMPELV